MERAKRVLRERSDRHSRSGKIRSTIDSIGRSAIEKSDKKEHATKYSTRDVWLQTSERELGQLFLFKNIIKEFFYFT